MGWHSAGCSSARLTCSVEMRRMRSSVVKLASTRTLKSGQREYPHQPRDGRTGRGPGLADGLPTPGLRLRTRPGRVRLVATEKIPRQPGKTRLRSMQYQPGLFDGFLAGT
jgi:hypothetical protein